MKFIKNIVKIKPGEGKMVLTFFLFSFFLVAMGLVAKTAKDAYFLSRFEKSILPLMFLGVAIFIGAYAQQFLFAITFNQDRDYMPLPAGIFEFIGYQRVLWNEMMAASLVGILPVLVIFLFMQKHLIAGLTSGAVKE